MFSVLVRFSLLFLGFGFVKITKKSELTLMSSEVA
jgi:hypothetical protein